MTPLHKLSTIDRMDRCEIYCGKNVISSRSLLLVSIINLLFSPRNLPQLDYTVCNLCLCLFCNCKITNKVSMEKDMSDQVKYCHVLLEYLTFQCKLQNFLSD